MKDRQNLIEQMSVFINTETLSKDAIAVSCASVAERYHKDNVINISKEDVWNIIESYAPNLSDEIGWGTMDSLCEELIKSIKNES